MDTSKKLNQKGIEKLADFTQRAFECVIAQLSADPAWAAVLGSEEFELTLSAFQEERWQELSSFRDCVVQCDLHNGHSYEYIDFSPKIVFSDPKSVRRSLTSPDAAIELVRDLVPDQVRSLQTTWSDVLMLSQSILINSDCHLSSTNCHLFLTLLFFPAADEME